MAQAVAHVVGFMLPKTSNKMRKHIIFIVLGVIIAFPVITFAGTFAISVLGGKTPTEAMSSIVSQINTIFGKVSSIETEQVTLSNRINEVEINNNSLKLQVMCSELEKDVPLTSGTENWGDVSTVNKFYARTLYLLKTGYIPKQLSYEAQPLYKAILLSLKEKYGNYASKCGGEPFAIVVPVADTNLCLTYASQFDDIKSILTVKQQGLQSLQKEIYVLIQQDSPQSTTTNKQEEFKSLQAQKALLQKTIDSVQLNKEELETKLRSHLCGFK
ncbi:MAG: hypothetical protein V4524_03395 [Patescibacteria group bacterium]